MFPETAKTLKYKAYLRRKEFRRAKLDIIETVERKMPIRTVVYYLFTS